MRIGPPHRRKLFLTLGPALLLLLGCAGNAQQGFVTLEHGAFTEDGRPFFPLAINYIAHLEFDDTSCWAAPMLDPHRTEPLRSDARGPSLQMIKAEFELIRKLGFNTVRIVGIASDLVLSEGDDTLHLQASYDNGKDSIYVLAGDQGLRYLQAIDELIQVAALADLKVILLVRMVPGRREYEQQLSRLADHLRDRPALMAYDLFNEPLYFDIHDRPKKEVHELVKRWQRLLKSHAPDQLTTIGLVGVPEVFAWDPNVLDVDFISFHPYEYEPDQVLNEIHWYGEYVDKPWIIGETSLPADNDSVPYADQLSFARKTLAQTRACGGVGYSWWQFKDVKWGRFHADHMGVLDQVGWTEVGQGLPRVEGTVKPVAEAFREFDPHGREGECIRPGNYYNYSSLSGAKLTGRLLDQDGQPIEGGVVIGWNEHWSRSYYTLSKADGSFELFGDFLFHHWMASATRHAMVRGDSPPNGSLTGADRVPAYYVGDLVLEHVPFADPPGKY